MPNRVLSSLIEKISNYATRINSEAGFVDKSWTYIDEDGQTVRLLFKGNSRLLINQRGRVTEGSWEFIPQWGGLLVEIDGEKSLYNQAMVFDDAVMLLKIDGTDDYLPLSDDKVVVPNEIENFLEKIQEKRLVHPVQKNVLKQPKEKFNPAHYPDLKSDIQKLRETIKNIGKEYSREIIITYCKEHSINSTWANANPELTNLAVSKKIPIGLIERLFRLNRENQRFVEDLENFLIEEL